MCQWVLVPSACANTLPNRFSPHQPQPPCHNIRSLLIVNITTVLVVLLFLSSHCAQPHSSKSLNSPRQHPLSLAILCPSPNQLFLDQHPNNLPTPNQPSSPTFFSRKCHLYTLPLTNKQTTPRAVVTRGHWTLPPTLDQYVHPPCRYESLTSAACHPLPSPLRHSRTPLPSHVPSPDPSPISCLGSRTLL